jgi:two-component system, sensor histidine kinase and response regulator
VIEDKDHFRQVVHKFLAKQGFEAVGAPDGKAGMGLAAEALPDLVVCDLNMPGMDGYQVLATLRREPRLANIPVIFLTGQSEPGQVSHGMNLGADDYLTKPVSFDDLLGAINVRLSRRLAQRQRQRKQMERAMELFGGIVHDLRDPLFVVLGYTKLLKRTAGEPAGPEASRNMLKRMQQAIVRMQRLPFDPVPFDLREFCQQLVTDHEGSQRLRLVCAQGQFPVVADALRLRQALDNLLSNALKYSDGLVELRLAAAPPEYLIEVRDQGIGIPPADQAGIFEPFFRASNTAQRPGHGLGLSVVESCIEQQGGSVRFTSELNRGTTFFLELPKSPPPGVEGVARQAEPPRAAPAPQRATPSQASAKPAAAVEPAPATSKAETDAPSTR